MKILICSKISDFSEKLIERLNKEKQEVYQLTGISRYEEMQKSRAFQVYTFGYQNENVNRIIANIAPEVMVIAGYCDTGYHWGDEGKQSARFVSDVSNLIVSAKNAGVRRVIFCSTIGVYEENKGEVITVETEPVPSSLQMKTYLQVENMCREFKDANCEISILRFPELYGELTPHSPWDICLKMTESYIKGGSICYREGASHRLLYLEDGIEQVFQAIFLEEPENCYTIPGEVHTEKEIALALKGTELRSDVTLEIQNNIKGESQPVFAEDKEEKKKFFRKYSLEKGIEQLSKRYKALAKKEEKQKEKKETLWSRIGVPLLETIGFFIVVWVISGLMADSRAGEGLDIYLLYVAVIGGVYGIAHALFASVLCAAAKIIAGFEAAGVSGLMSDYSTFLSVLQVLLIAIIVGYLRDKYKRINSDLTDENQYLSSELADMTRINDNNVYIKDVYEKRLVNYSDGLAKLYDITSRLDFMASRKVMFEAVNVVMEIMDTKDVAVYTASRNSRYFRLSAASSRRAYGLGNSLKFDQSSEYYGALSEKEIYMNRGENLEKPVFAGATYLNEEVTSLVFVWQRKLENVNLHESNLMAILCRLIEKAMGRAFLYEESIRRDSYYGDTVILTEDAFSQVLLTYQEGWERGYLKYTLMELQKPSQEETEKVQRLVRDTDVLGFKEGNIDILLSNTAGEDVQMVLQRFESAGLQPSLVEEKGSGNE